MKILHVIDDLSPGGAERLIESSLPLMKKKGHQVYLLLLENNQCHYRDRIIEAGIPIIVAPANDRKRISNVFYIKRIVKKYEIDIVHAHLFPVLYWVSFANFLSFSFPKTIYTEHSDTNKRRKIKLLRNIEKLIYSNYNFITCISESVYSSLLNWLNLSSSNSNKIKVIENGIDLDYFVYQPQKKMLDIDIFFRKEKIITMVGRFHESKDQKTLIDSMVLLPNDVNLFLVGIGDTLESFKKYVIKKKLNKRVHFLGYREDVKEIIQMSNIVVLSSKKEGFGLSAIEAMAMGKPVVASEIDGLSEVISNKKLLFEMGNPHELASIINRLLVNEEMYKELSEYCLERSKLYNISTMVDNWIKLYEKEEIK